MTIRKLIHQELLEYLNKQTAIMGISNPEEFIKDKMDGLSIEESKEIAEMFTVYIDDGEIKAGIGIYDEKYLQDAIFDDGLEKFDAVIKYLIHKNSSPLRLYSETVPLKYRDEVGEILIKAGFIRTQGILVGKSIFGTERITKLISFQPWSQSEDQDFQRYYEEQKDFLDFPWEVIKNRMGGVFTPELWFLDKKSHAILGINHPSSVAEANSQHSPKNSHIYTIIAIFPGNSDITSIIDFAITRLYEIEPDAHLNAYINPKNLSAFLDRGFNVISQQEIYEFHLNDGSSCVPGSCDQKQG